MRWSFLRVVEFFRRTDVLRQENPGVLWGDWTVSGSAPRIPGGDSTYSIGRENYKVLSLSGLNKEATLQYWGFRRSRKDRTQFLSRLEWDQFDVSQTIYVKLAATKSLWVRWQPWQGIPNSIWVIIEPSFSTKRSFVNWVMRRSTRQSSTSTEDKWRFWGYFSHPLSWWDMFVWTKLDL